MFIVAYGLGICLFMPAMLLTAIGATLYGAIYGFYFNMAGSMLGASLAFFIGRYFGHHLFSSIVAERLSKYENKLAKNGFATTFYLRLICFPFTPLSFGMGLTRVTFLQYFWGTFFGKLASGFMITFFFATAKDVVVSGQYDQLFTVKSLIACTVFVCSLYIPKLLRVFKLDGYFEPREKGCSVSQ